MTVLCHDALLTCVSVGFLNPQETRHVANCSVSMTGRVRDRRLFQYRLSTEASQRYAFDRTFRHSVDSTGKVTGLDFGRCVGTRLSTDRDLTVSLCVSIRTLKLSHFNGRCENGIVDLREMKALQDLDVSDSQSMKGFQLNDSTIISRVSIMRCHGITDIGFVENVRCVNVVDCCGIVDVSPLQRSETVRIDTRGRDVNLRGLEDLGTVFDLHLCNVRSLSNDIIDRYTAVRRLTIEACENITDVAVLTRDRDPSTTPRYLCVAYCRHVPSTIRVDSFRSNNVHVKI